MGSDTDIYCLQPGRSSLLRYLFLLVPYCRASATKVCRPMVCRLGSLSSVMDGNDGPDDLYATSALRTSCPLHSSIFRFHRFNSLLCCGPSICYIDNHFRYDPARMLIVVSYQLLPNGWDRSEDGYQYGHSDSHKLDEFMTLRSIIVFMNCSSSASEAVMYE
jgi:hypothetical protein